jgi:hypothetical protein
MKTWKLFFLSVLGFLQFGRQVIRYALIFLSAFLRSRSSLGCELVAIRSQLTFYKESIRQKKQSRPRFTPAFRLLWVLLSRVWSGWKSAADLMKPKTVLQLSTRKTLRKADSGATGQHHSRTASVCETVVLQLKVSLRRTNVQRTHSVSFVFFDCPAGRKSGRHSNVAVMQSTDNRNRNQATRSGHGFRCGRGERCSTI